MKLIEIVSDIVCNTLLDPRLLNKARRRKGAFTRNCGKLPFWTVMKLLLSNVKKTISATLDDFFSALRKQAGMSPDETIVCSQQAFSKARSGIDHSIFRECFYRVLGFLCSSDSLEFNKRLGGLWGVQFIAIDGSKIPLPNRKQLRSKYGGMGRDASSPTAIASIAYDVLNDRILEAEFEPINIDERTLAKRHLTAIKASRRVNLFYSMFVFDRGYASEDLINFIEKNIGTRYLFRLRDKFSTAIDALPVPEAKDGIIDRQIELYEGIKVRILRFFLPSGTLETLVTNDFEHDKSMFREYYFYRWPVEGEYRLIKEKTGLTCFRGYSENSILQEFWIAMLLTNLANVIKGEADGLIKYSHHNGEELRHSYKTNMNELMGALSRHLPEYMDADTSPEKQAIIRHVINFLIHKPVVDKKGTCESNPRKEARHVKNHYNVKNTH